MIHPICTSCDSYPCACGRSNYVSRPELCKPAGGVESGWLIESTCPTDRIVWMGAVVGLGRWTSNADHAIRFARKQDAENVIESMTRHGLASVGFAIATEHQWG